MASGMVRKHFLLPRELAEELAKAAGELRQSETVCRLIEQWLRNRRLNRIVHQHGGSSLASDHPEWADGSDISHTIRALRAEQRPVGDPRSVEP